MHFDSAAVGDQLRIPWLVGDQPLIGFRVRTGREVEVLALVAEGLPNRVVGERLYLSVHTVRNHVQRILEKLHVHSKLEAVAVAVREGVIVLPR